MALLMMRGEPVLNALDYARLFDLYDALRGREYLCSFARTHLCMDYLDVHHGEMLRRAVLGRDFEDRRDFYWDAYEPKADLPRADAEPTDAEREIALRFYDQTAAIAAEPERLRICAAATAATLLAGREASEPLDAPRALDIWRGEERDAAGGGMAIGERVDANLVLRAREEPYALPTLRAAPDKLEIVTYRIDVLPVSLGDGGKTARLEARGESEEVRRGGTAYVNAHEGLVTHILKNRVRNGEIEMARDGDELVLTVGGHMRRISGEGVTCFAPEAFEGGYLLIKDCRLDISHAWRRNTDSNLQWLAARNGAVEVQTRGQYYLVLLANGRVISDNPAWDDRRGVTRLDDIEG